MALRDTSWIVDSHFLETSRKVGVEIFTFFFGTAVTRRRTRTITDAECVAVTKAAAQNFVDTTIDTNTAYRAVEDVRYCGAWKVLRHVDSRGVVTTDT